MNRKSFLKQATLASLGLVLGTSCTRGGGQGAPQDKEYTFGHGSHRYKLRKNWAQVDPGKFPIKDAHEMVQTRDGRLFLITNETKNNILIFNKDGKLLQTWGNNYPGGHGLTLHEEGGEEFLYLCDYELHQVIKTTLDGKVVLTLDAPLDAAPYNQASQFRPTETAIGPDGSIFVADGYGAQWISVFAPDGRLKHVFGGPAHFQNAHGICLDTRGETACLLITAREQNKLKRFSLDGEWLEDLSFPGAFMNRAVIRGQHVYLSVLKSAHHPGGGSGFLMILDENNQLISCPTGSDPELFREQGQELHQTIELFRHPHDVCVDADENLYIPQWNSGQVYPYMLERI